MTGRSSWMVERVCVTWVFLSRRGGIPAREFPIFFTHFHWDHVQGIPFFGPAWVKGNRLIFASPFPSMERTIRDQMKPPYFPVTDAPLRERGPHTASTLQERLGSGSSFCGKQVPDACALFKLSSSPGCPGDDSDSAC